MSSTRKASFFLLYCLVALTAVGTAFSHFWRSQKQLRHELVLQKTAPLVADASDATPE